MYENKATANAKKPCLLKKESFEILKTDNQDTRNLETHLRSLSKFYDTSLSENQTQTNRKNRYMIKTLTMQNLMEMAKEVSDQMVLTKAEVIFSSYANRATTKIFQI